MVYRMPELIGRLESNSIRGGGGKMILWLDEVYF